MGCCVAPSQFEHTTTMDLLRYTVDAISEMIDSGMAPIPILASFGLPYSIFDLAGSLRLAFVLRQLREAERAKAIKLQEKLASEGITDVKQIEEPYIVKDLVTVLTVIYGGEAICCKPVSVHISRVTEIFCFFPLKTLVNSTLASIYSLFPNYADVSPTIYGSSSTCQRASIRTRNVDTYRTPFIFL
jgi:hypothetical protein